MKVSRQQEMSFVARDLGKLLLKGENNDKMKELWKKLK